MGSASAQGTKADYERSESLPRLYAGKLYRNSIRPHWLAGGKQLWYAIETGPNKREYWLIDARSGVKEMVLDLGRLATALSGKVATSVSRESLSVDILSADKSRLTILTQEKTWLLDRKTYALSEYTGSAVAGASATLKPFLPPKPSQGGEETTITFENRSSQPVQVVWMSTTGERVPYHTLKPGETKEQHTFAGHVWVFVNSDSRALAAFEAAEGPCTAIYEASSPEQPRPVRSTEVSPGGKWRAFVRQNDVWLKSMPGEEEIRVTSDGRPEDGYGGRMSWSPDGRFILATRTEAGQEHKVTIVQSRPPGQLQPKLITLDYLKPGDKIPLPKLVIFEAATRKRVPVETDQLSNPWEYSDFHWSPDGRELYFVYNQRGHQLLRLMAADTTTGKTRTIVEEKSPTFIDYQAKLWVTYLDKTNEAIWMSEGSGYNHLYLVNLKTGHTKPITQGPWMIRSVEKVDTEKRQLIIRAMGKNLGEDPYHMHFARVGFDGAGFTALTDGDGTHSIAWSPDGETYLDTYSRVDLAPVTELRRTRDGKKLVVLESGDDSVLRSTGWQVPERFTAKARDGKTDIYGTILRPSNFDPAKKYPVIESVYAGPQGFFVPKAYAAYRPQLKLAELGFIVVQIDGMGTDWRGKAFHDVCYKNLGDAGFPDRILWIRSAAASRPWMDISRVGVYGTSAGGQNAASAVLRFGDFYKAAVADCGCHDNRMDKVWWNELWMGWPVSEEVYDNSSNVIAAKNLKGKLFLMVGEVDSNVDPASTMQVVAELIKAGKDFDLLVVPNSNHGVLGQPYAFRRMEDFFVRALYNVEPRN
jgi:dipeptidyl-peptidase 4